MNKDVKIIGIAIGIFLCASILLSLPLPKERKEMLEEAEKPEESKSPEWWLNSGGYMLVTSEGVSTILGALTDDSIWKVLYAQNNPLDTKEGLYPQNIFRLLTKNIIPNNTFEMYAEIKHLNAVESPNRDESNGIMIFQRYQDSNNLYYAGMRVDGNAVIKKKVNGTYYTLAQQKIFNGKYSRENNIPLFPLEQEIGLKVETQDNADGSVMINLFLDKENTGEWRKILTATDDGTTGGKPLQEKGRAGIRTDFMDAIFKKIRISA